MAGHDKGEVGNCAQQNRGGREDTVPSGLPESHNLQSFPLAKKNMDVVPNTGRGFGAAIERMCEGLETRRRCILTILSRDMLCSIVRRGTPPFTSVKCLYYF